MRQPLILLHRFQHLWQHGAGILEHAMVKEAPSELHVAAIQAVLEVAAHYPQPFAALYRGGGQLAWLKSFLTHTDATGE